MARDPVKEFTLFGAASNRVKNGITRFGKKTPISRGVFYISDVLNSDYSLMTYAQFCDKWSLNIPELSSKPYVDNKMSLHNIVIFRQ